MAGGALGSGRSTRNPKKGHLDKTPTMVHGNVLEPAAALRPLTVTAAVTSPYDCTGRPSCTPRDVRRGAV
jgi:hypothetical protein